MKRVYYIPTLQSGAFPDAVVEDATRAFLRSPRDRIEVSNELFLLAVRVLVKEGMLPHDEIVFVLPDGTDVPIDKDGRCSMVFDDTSVKLLMRVF